LQDIFAVGDRVMVLKRGENVGERVIRNTTEHEVLQIIVSGVKSKTDGGPPAQAVRTKAKPAAKRVPKK
jgi:simple sugar transport system ATP-binding protein